MILTVEQDVLSEEEEEIDDLEEDPFPESGSEEEAPRRSLLDLKGRSLQHPLLRDFEQQTKARQKCALHQLHS